MGFDNFLRQRDTVLWGDYLREKLIDLGKPKIEIKADIHTKAPLFRKSVLDGMRSIDELPEDDDIKKYVLSRQIPKEAHGLLYRCDKFYSFVNNIVPGKISPGAMAHDNTTLLIPFFTDNGKIFGFSGRSMQPKATVRYLNIILDEYIPKLYGQDRWDKTKETLVVEGPLDSLFLPNCLATMGNKMPSALQGFDKEQFVCIYDNEKRSETTRQKITEAINHGYKVVIWPHGLSKDINDMILDGHPIERIIQIIRDHSYSGLRARLELSR